MLKRLFSFLVAIFIAVSPVLVEAKTYRSSYEKSSFISQESIYKASKSSGHSYPYGSKTFRQQKGSVYPKSTYDVGETKYNYNERYKSSGLPKVNRSESAKRQFLRSKGYKRVPSGYEVDHIIPLSKGGRDEPSNMQLIPKSVHKQKTAEEKRR